MATLKRITIAACAILVALAGCSDAEKYRVEFEGRYYAAKAKSLDSKDRTGFVVSVRDANEGFDGARQAAAYEATKYCVTMLGTSDIEWTLSPDAPEEALMVDGKTLIVQGSCVE